MTTTCNHALYAIIDVFTQYFDIMSPILIDDLYTQLKWCIKQDNEQLARSGTNCLENFIISNGIKFNEQIWAKTCDCIVDVFSYIQPNDLLTWKPDKNDGFYAQNGHYHDQESVKSKRTDSITSLNSSFSEDSHQQTQKSKIPHLKVPLDMEHRVFHSLLIKCVVQLELIQSIDNIIFYPTTSKKEDASLVAAAQVC
jgi:brefeldin A-inhibited guanine nucleotide-exchange protein